MNGLGPFINLPEEPEELHSGKKFCILRTMLKDGEKIWTNRWIHKPRMIIVVLSFEIMELVVVVIDLT